MILLQCYPGLTPAEFDVFSLCGTGCNTRFRLGPNSVAQAVWSFFRP